MTSHDKMKSEAELVRDPAYTCSGSKKDFARYVLELLAENERLRQAADAMAGALADTVTRWERRAASQAHLYDSDAVTTLSMCADDVRDALTAYTELTK